MKVRHFAALVQSLLLTATQSSPLLAQDAPRLNLEQVALAGRVPETASLGTVSSVAAGRDATIYVLQRGDKADPVIATDREGRVLRSWGKGMFTVPHSVRIDGDGNVWTVDAGRGGRAGGKVCFSYAVRDYRYHVCAERAVVHIGRLRECSDSGIHVRWKAGEGLGKLGHGAGAVPDPARDCE